MKKYYGKVILSLLTCLWYSSNNAFAYTAISVPQNAKLLIDEAQNELRDKNNKKILDDYNIKADKYLQEALVEYNRAKLALEAAQKRYENAQVSLTKSSDGKKQAEKYVTNEKKRLQDAQTNPYVSKITAQEHLDTANDVYNKAINNYEAAQKEYEDARAGVEHAQNDWDNAVKNLDDAKKNKVDIVYKLETPDPVQVIVSQLKYYSWKTSGDSGYEVVRPLYYGYKSLKDNYDFGIYTSLVRAQHEGNDTTSLSSTSLQFRKRYKTTHVQQEYSLKVTVPTGAVGLSRERLNTRMSDDLVPVGQFSEGWKIEPGVQFDYPIGENDVLRIGTSYLWSQSYDPTEDIANDDISPGNEWSKWLQYRHIEEKYQLIATLMHTNYAKTTFADGSSYHLSNELKYQLTYNRKLDEKNDLLLYYWQEQSGNDDSQLANSASDPVYYYGVSWKNKLDKIHTLSLYFDVMDTDGNRYAGYHNGRYTEVLGRQKYTVGLDYGIKISDKRFLDFAVEYFRMKDGISSDGEAAKKYNGMNFMASYIWVL